MPAFSIPGNYAFDSYSALVAAINDWLDRSDLTGAAQSMVALAEARMRRELTPYFAEIAGSFSTALGVGLLPPDFGTMSRVSYNGRTLSQAPLASGFNVPKDGLCPEVYTLENGSLRVWPSGSFGLEILYRPTLPALSDATPNNSVLSDHPDLYFFGSMLFANGYLANDPRAALFKTLWDEALDSCKSYMIRQQYDGAMAPRVAFVP